MAGPHQKFAWILLAGFLCLPIVTPAYGAGQHSRKRAVKQEKPVPAPQAPPPQAGLTLEQLALEQLPASAPQVSFRDGQLTIVATNSTLGDILRGVRGQTGAAVEIPSSATERVVGQLGPGPARDVLASLLNGSHFNYVMLGSTTDPSQVSRIILTSKSVEAPSGGSEAVNQPNSPQAQALAVAGQAQEPEEMQGDDAAEDASDADNQPDQAAEDQQQAQPNGQPVIKTPEQLLQELQRQQQIQQQQPPRAVPQMMPNPQNEPQQQ